MTLMTKEQAEAKRAEIKMEIQKSDVRMQEMQCAIAKTPPLNRGDRGERRRGKTAQGRAIR
jgi:hypothetical protein